MGTTIEDPHHRKQAITIDSNMEKFLSKPLNIRELTYPEGIFDVSLNTDIYAEGQRAAIVQQCNCVSGKKPKGLAADIQIRHPDGDPYRFRRNQQPHSQYCMPEDRPRPGTIVPLVIGTKWGNFAGMKNDANAGWERTSLKKPLLSVINMFAQGDMGKCDNSKRRTKMYVKVPEGKIGRASWRERV